MYSLINQHVVNDKTLLKSPDQPEPGDYWQLFVTIWLLWFIRHLVEKYNQIKPNK